MVLCDQRKEIIKGEGHQLIKGGPGSGKTTISLIKAADYIQHLKLQKGQKVLFLSFARATISRVMEDAKEIIPLASQKLLDINTYHGFTWSIIQSYGNLLLPKWPLQLLTPPEAASRFSGMNQEQRRAISKLILANEGIITFDLFAELAGELFSRCKKITNIFTSAYPLIFVDEFQDTDPYEWKLIQQLGSNSSIVALADPYQRIYDFRGASPLRLKQFSDYFTPKVFDFGDENNRSTNTDICIYGNDLLRGLNQGKTYKNVVINKYGYDSSEPMSSIKYALLTSVSRLKKSKPDGNWSIAILVKSKVATLKVSTYLSRKSPRLTSFAHEVLIDPSGPSLAAVIISGLMEPGNNENLKIELISNLISHLRGKKDKMTQADGKLSEALLDYQVTNKVRGSGRQTLINELERIVYLRNELELLGVPEIDWLKVRNLIGECSHEALKDVFEDSKYLRLLNKGALLSERLSASWRKAQNYAGAKKSVKDALLREHFSMSTRSFRGILVMTLHKSKGKQFDEVIIWEDKYNSIVPYNADRERIEQARLVLRVGVTRAKSQTTISTAAAAPCILV